MIGSAADGFPIHLIYGYSRAEDETPEDLLRNLFGESPEGPSPRAPDGLDGRTPPPVSTPTSSHELKTPHPTGPVPSRCRTTPHPQGNLIDATGYIVGGNPVASHSPGLTLTAGHPAAASENPPKQPARSASATRFL